MLDDKMENTKMNILNTVLDFIAAYPYETLIGFFMLLIIGLYWIGLQSN